MKIQPILITIAACLLQTMATADDEAYGMPNKIFIFADDMEMFTPSIPSEERFRLLT